MWVCGIVGVWVCECMDYYGGGWIGRRKEKGGREGSREKGREVERWDWSHVYMYI